MYADIPVRALNQAIGQYVTKIDKRGKGFILTLSSYSAVFSYMLRNENDFADELARALGVPRSDKPITREVVVSKTGTTTGATGTSSVTVVTTLGTTTETFTPSPFVFTDITVSNQNMRIATSASSTVVYAFIGTQKLLIASSIEELLSLRSSLSTK